MSLVSQCFLLREWFLLVDFEHSDIPFFLDSGLLLTLFSMEDLISLRLLWSSLLFIDSKVYVF